MLNNIKNMIVVTFRWYEKNVAKLLLTAVVYFVLHGLVKLPYLNLIAGLLYFVPYFVAWIFAFFIFNPHRRGILIVCFILFILSFILTLIPFQRLQVITENFGNIIFLLLFSYIILTMKDLKKQQ